MTDANKIRLIAELLNREYALDNLSFTINEQIIEDLKSIANNLEYYEKLFVIKSLMH